MYSLPEAPFVPQTPISSTAVNSDFSDIASALTASLPRNGEAGMTGQLPLAATGFNYTIDPDTGMRRSAANEQMIFCGGVDVVKITTGGLFDGVTGASLGFAVGVPYIWPFSDAPTGCVFLYGQACTSSYPIIRALLIASGSPYGTSGADPLFPDYRGVAPVGKSNMGGVDKGNLTGATVLGAILGAQTVTLDATMMPAHTHTGSGTTATENAQHTHNVSGTTGVESAGHVHIGTTDSGGPAAHNHNVPNRQNLVNINQGGGTATQNLWQGDGGTTSGTENSSLQHTHTFTTGTESAQHIHGLNIDTSVELAVHAHTYSFTTSSAGGGAAHANVQPSIVQNYIMRVA